MLKLHATYIPNVYRMNKEAGTGGHYEGGTPLSVTIVAVMSSDQALSPELLAVDENGNFVSDIMTRFTCTDPSQL